MKSVCILLQNYYDFDIRVRRKAEALVAAGYSVDVLAIQGRDGRKSYVLNGVNVTTVSLGKKRGSLARYAYEYLAFFLWCMFKLTSLMRTRRYAVVDVNTLPDFLVFAAVFARWMGAKVVLDMHEITPEFYRSKYGMPENSMLVKVLELQERLSFNFADQVITINEPIEDLFVSRGLDRTKSTIITNAADETKFLAYKPGGKSAASKEPGTFVFMYHGTLTNLYGLDIAIEAFAKAHQEMPGAEMWILGEGPESPRLMSLASERGLNEKVKLIGVVQPSAIPDWLYQADVGLLPIRLDVFLQYASPNKLAEYIIMNKAVIISRLRAIRHYFSEDALAFCNPNDPEDLAKQMVRVYLDGNLRSQLATKALREYEPIRWDVMKERYLKLIERISGSAKVGQANAIGASK
ncbi:MAG TPA: glycosyltransferase family 4 protein [Candidatus Nanoarchaeia archaeon]|nr:glycosyltransferase family 4 protein [Candidatus Nanoarchaeia archaeon]